MKKFLKAFYGAIPAPLKNLQNSLRLKDRLLLCGKNKREQKLVQAIQRKISNGEKVNVAFFAMSVAFWKYDELFQLMANDKRFNPTAVFTPRPLDTQEIQDMHKMNLETFFKKKGFPFSDNLSSVNPDIIFYAQPYKNSICESLRAYNHLDKLICYVPYAFFISNYRWAYDAQVHNLAWKLFYPSELHRQNAREIAFNKGCNVEVSGYPLADKFLTPASSDPWKIKDRSVKRIVWGVHHSILSDDLADCGTFLDNADSMLERAKSLNDFQFAFKPHPHLKEHLYKHPAWGKERTDAYYKSWNEAPNTFLFENDYIDLFKTSDALIHDCGSFTVEYLYVDKPVLYIGNERSQILCNFGKAAMEANYTKADFSIDEFLQKVVASENECNTEKDDFKKNVREKFVEQHLLPPNNKSFAQNIMDILSAALNPKV